MAYLSSQEIKGIHLKYSPSKKAFDLIYTHSQIVHDIACECARNKDIAVDRDLLQAGAMLHDIGVYRHITQQGKIIEKKYITHGIDGEKILLDEGIDPKIARFCAYHTGVGITKEEIERRGLPLPAKDYFAKTPEE